MDGRDDLKLLHRFMRTFFCHTMELNDNERVEEREGRETANVLTFIQYDNDTVVYTEQTF